MWEQLAQRRYVMPGFDLWIASPTRYPSHHHAAPTTITVITRTLRERKPHPTPKVETKVFRVSNPDFRINLDPSIVQIGRWFMWEMLTNVQKSPIPQWWRTWKVIWNPHADPDHQQKLITSRGSTLAHACQVWSTSVSEFVSYPVYRMTDKTIT